MPGLSDTKLRGIATALVKLARTGPVAGRLDPELVEALMTARGAEMLVGEVFDTTILWGHCSGEQGLGRDDFVKLIRALRAPIGAIGLHLSLPADLRRSKGGSGQTMEIRAASLPKRVPTQEMRAYSGPDEKGPSASELRSSVASSTFRTQEISAVRLPKRLTPTSEAPAPGTAGTAPVEVPPTIRTEGVKPTAELPATRLPKRATTAEIPAARLPKRATTGELPAAKLPKRATTSELPAASLPKRVGSMSSRK